MGFLNKIREKMTSTITIISPSINRDKAFRERLTGNLTSDKELLAVIREAFNGEKNDMFSREGGEISVDESRYDGNNGGCVGGGKSKREELEIRAKLFLQDFDSDSATDAIEAVLKHIGTSHMDSLHVAVPAVASGAIGISSETKEHEEDYWRRLKQFKDLWATVESIADQGKITSIGLCDVETETLQQIHDGAGKVKPSSITVNLRSCCVVPDDMSEFAKTNNLKLLTHSDPEIMLDEATLEREVSGEKFAPDFIVRYQIMDKERGVLKDKRYIVRLKRKL